MVPMHSVPHRVVCLLGRRTGPFRGPQRSTATTSLPRDPVTGELDVRSQDQYLLLDAVMTANEKLVPVSTAANPGPARSVRPGSLQRKWPDHLSTRSPRVSRAIPRRASRLRSGASHLEVHLRGG